MKPPGAPDPFRVQQVDANGLIEEVDASARVLDGLRGHGIDAVIAIVGGSAVTGSHAISVMWKLARRGLPCVCIPKSVENDLEATTQPYGYASVLQGASETLRQICLAARDQGRVALVEVPGQSAGWLAIDAGLAVAADVVLVPEFAYDVDVVARHLEAHRSASLVIVADGAAPLRVDTDSAAADSMRRCLSPGSDPTFGSGASVIHRQGVAVQALYVALQRRSQRDLLPLVLDQLVRATTAVAADRVLAASYGAAAVQALAAGCGRHLIAAQALDCQVLPLEFVVNRVRTLDVTSPVLANARAQGICLGDER